MRVTILGCGGSSGTPAVDWGWANCDPDNPKNRRLRPSILIEQPSNDACFLIDTSPDLRQQLLNADIRHLDALFYTHFHADHLHGIDDLRPVNRLMKRAIDTYGDAATLKVIEERFGYVFEPLSDEANGYYYKPTLTPHEFGPGGDMTIKGVRVRCFAQDHGYSETLGFRFDQVAYTTDVVNLPEKAFEILEGVGLWIIGTLISEPHPTHADVGKALEWIERIKPDRAILTHMSSQLDYETLKQELPDGVEPAYDGLVIDIP